MTGPSFTVLADGTDTDTQSTEQTSESAVPPAAPTGLVAVSHGPDIELTWEPVEGATGYEIYEYDSEEDEIYDLDYTTKTTYTDPDLAGDNIYSYYVTAIGPGGESGYSQMVSAEAYEFELPVPYATVHKGESVTPEYELYASGSIKWTSANPTIATVNQSGKITGKKVGSTTVTATYKEITYNISVSVCDLAIDVSHYQGKINWSLVKSSGVSVAMLKATEGTGYIDPTFNYNYNNAQKQGIKVGAYCFSHATTTAAAKKEAAYVMKLLKKKKGVYAICMDFESSAVIQKTNKDSRIKIINAFKKAVEKKGYKFILYTSSGWVKNYLIPEKLKNMNLWLARYNGGGTYPEYTGPGNIVMWQYGPRKINGIYGNTDANYLYNTKLK